MNNLLNDWRSFAAGEATFDESHFYTLFHENREPESLNMIFEDYDNKEELIHRVINYLNGRMDNPNANVEELISKDILEKRRVCEFLNDLELVGYLRNPNFTYISEPEFKSLWRQDCPHHWITEVIGDYLRPLSSSIEKDRILIDAFYGLTTDFNLTWYLGESFYQADYNPEYYFSVWKNNIDYIIGENEVFIREVSSR